MVDKTSVVYKVEYGRETIYLYEINERYLGDSVFTPDIRDAKRFTRLQAIRMARRLNNGLDQGVFRQYGCTHDAGPSRTEKQSWDYDPDLVL